MEINEESFIKLEEQVANLNKGIATYRDEANTYKSKSETLEKEFKEFKDKIEFEAEEDKEVELHPEDQKKLEAWATKKGMITKNELEAEKAKIHQDSLRGVENQAISEFLEKHKEYDNDELWQKVQAEFSLYKTPASIDGYKKLLERIHKDFTGNKSSDDAKAKALAELKIKGRLTLGGGNQGSDEDNNTDVDSLSKKYPNLSRDQIEARVAEIKSLYPKK